jgi:alpha-galactosidase
MTHDEYVSHFSMWALLKSPLILGNDVTNMTAETLSIITNDALIGANQDTSGGAARRMWKKPASGGGDLSLWSAGFANDTAVFALLNTSPKNQTVTLEMDDVFFNQVRLLRGLSQCGLAR